MILTSAAYTSTRCPSPWERLRAGIEKENGGDFGPKATVLDRGRPPSTRDSTNLAQAVGVMPVPCCIHDFKEEYALPYFFGDTPDAGEQGAMR